MPIFFSPPSQTLVTTCGARISTVPCPPNVLGTCMRGHGPLPPPHTPHAPPPSPPRPPLPLPLRCRHEDHQPPGLARPEGRRGGGRGLPDRRRRRRGRGRGRGWALPQHDGRGRRGGGYQGDRATKQSCSSRHRGQMTLILSILPFLFFFLALIFMKLMIKFDFFF